MKASKSRYMGRHIWCTNTSITENIPIMPQNWKHTFTNLIFATVFRPSARYLYLCGDCFVNIIVSSLHYGDVMFESMNSISL